VITRSVRVTVSRLNANHLGRDMKITRALIAGIAAATVTLTATGCESLDSGQPGTAADRADTKDAAKKDAKNVDASGKPKTKGKNSPVAPKETAGQAQARQSAASYLDLTGFSREGLIDQLVQGEGFSKADATYGVDAQHADWNKQAALSAKQYLDMTSFSHSGLVDQLMQGDGYTREQAEYGVKQVGL
jgi:hypothetical protein